MTLWLTRITPDPRSRDARRDSAGAVDLHHRMMSLFPDHVADDEPRRRLGVLFRTEATAAGDRILLQSGQQPELDRLPVGYGQAVSKPLTPLLDALRPGLHVRYRIAANPIRRPSRATRELYRLKAVVPLQGTAADDWWARQAEASGLNLGTLHSSPLEAAKGNRRSDQRPVRHDRVLFEGTAVITDADRLRARLTDGIGKGKAYGCGLLSIAPHQGPE
ncbi:type I-E CRISPR-associated protein Cas6/Cse3/CasE [Streptomyces sp. CBMA156]|uniref:type I-E CRISPR-associated protein Cas6/Cse3/CasE n=1 Tax=Streptomyces sp. CBMA156 TaxID=1930280 RepID=UPI001661B8C9|nr:type I-E CRISPR-associated protein Cas6/Cse3/CasE [Streptomyces sp. CBMA156]MBD0670753.1 type I-E CRISPR-associated protein Cas6/Cse3/CasE [Streptomyces sp. CBMA156]